MQSLGTLTNSVDLSDKHAGVSGVDLSGILDNVTLDQLQEWSEKGWVSAQGSDGTTYYNANLAVIETVGNTGVEQLGGYGMNNGRAVTVGLVFSVTDDNKVSYTISSVSGGTGAVNLPEAPSDQIDEYSMATRVRQRDRRNRGGRGPQGVEGRGGTPRPTASPRRMPTGSTSTCATRPRRATPTSISTTTPTSSPIRRTPCGTRTATSTSAS